jgi:hypothetical protein
MTRFLVAIIILCSAGSASAATWAVGGGTGEGCYLRAASRGGAKYCHNCENAGGDHVYWSFALLCDGKDTGRRSRVYLSCTNNRSDEGGQLRSLMAKVRLPKAGTACPTLPRQPPRRRR